MFGVRGKVIGLAILLLVILGVLSMMQPGDTNATLVVSEGQVVVNQTGGAMFVGAANTAVAAGELLTVTEGDTVYLSDPGAAQLRLRDGSTVDLASGTMLAISELSMNNDTFRARFNLLAGRTFSQVMRLLKPGDTFEIRTPSSTASVRGTMFSVEIKSPDVTHYAVTEGVVQVAMGEQIVDVAAGFQVTAVVGQPLQIVPFEASTNIPPIDPTGTNQTVPTNTPEPFGLPTGSSAALETAVPTQENPGPENNDPVNQPTSQAPDDTTEDVTTNTDDSPEGGSTPPGQTNPNPQDNPGSSTPAPAPTNTPVILPTSTPNISPTNTPEIPSTNTPTLPPTNTPVVPPTSTPAPPPTNTPVPPPTNTPVPPPTNTPDAEELVTICHNGNTIQVNASAVDAHLAHGDTLGPCP